MNEIEALRKRALKHKESGLSDYEIAEELNISKDTTMWLLSKGKEKKPVGDVKIGWRSVGVHPSRIGFISDALSDIILEESEKRDLDIYNVVAAYVADELGLELALFRPHHEKAGAFSSNYASVKEKNVVIVDDVVGSGETFKNAIKATKAEKGKPVLCVCMVNKKATNDVDGVPLRGLIRARAL